MLPAGMEPRVPASEWPQTHALDRAAAGVGFSLLQFARICRLQSVSEKDRGFMKQSVVTDLHQVLVSRWKVRLQLPATQLGPEDR